MCVRKTWKLTKYIEPFALSHHWTLCGTVQTTFWPFGPSSPSSSCSFSPLFQLFPRIPRFLVLCTLLTNLCWQTRDNGSIFSSKKVPMTFAFVNGISNSITFWMIDHLKSNEEAQPRKLLHKLIWKSHPSLLSNCNPQFGPCIEMLMCTCKFCHCTFASYEITFALREPSSQGCVNSLVVFLW